MVNSLKAYCEKKNKEDTDEFGDGGNEQIEYDALFNQNNNANEDADAGAHAEE